MAEITNLIKMKAIENLHIIETPNGKFIYVGNVPVEIAYIDPTPEKLQAAKFGARFGPKTRSFETQAAAVAFANENGYNVA